MTKHIYSLFTLYFWSLISPCLSQDNSIATPSDGSSCWDNTTAIFQHLVVANPFSTNTYILCPDTVFKVGFTDSQGLCCEDGELPLMARTNTKFQCGEDGSSENNCVLVGGTTQVLMNDLTFSETEATNVIFQGLTFVDAGMTASMPNQAGDMTFLDCIFADAQNSGTVVSLYIAPNSGSNTNRRLQQAKKELEFAPFEQRIGYLMSEEYFADAMADADEERGRRLQEESPAQHERHLQDNVCRLFFNQTIFRNNTQGATQGVTTFGVITARSQSSFFSFDSCNFEDNNFGIREVAQQGYAIESWGSQLEVVNTCFLDNNFIGYGTVNVWDGGAYTSEGNYGTEDSELLCNFMALSDVRPEDELAVTCVGYDLVSCRGPKAPPSSAPPSAAPTAGGSSAVWPLTLNVGAMSCLATIIFLVV